LFPFWFAYRLMAIAKLFFQPRSALAFGQENWGGDVVIDPPIAIETEPPRPLMMADPVPGFILILILNPRRESWILNAA